MNRIQNAFSTSEWLVVSPPRIHFASSTQQAKWKRVRTKEATNRHSRAHRLYSLFIDASQCSNGKYSMKFTRNGESVNENSGEQMPFSHRNSLRLFQWFCCCWNARKKLRVWCMRCIWTDSHAHTSVSQRIMFVRYRRTKSFSYGVQTHSNEKFIFFQSHRFDGIKSTSR